MACDALHLDFWASLSEDELFRQRGAQCDFDLGGVSKNTELTISENLKRGQYFCQVTVDKFCITFTYIDLINYVV